jgi:hypothetical protein
MEHNQSNLGLDQCHDCGVRRKQVANPTTNYGFVLPTPTDLVTDLPADFDVALQGVDTRLKALQPGTTLGDLAYSSATADTNTSLGIGSTGDILTVAGGVPTWAPPAGAGSNWSLLNAGGTALTAAATITVSGISAKNSVMVVFVSASSANAGATLGVRINTDTTTKYDTFGTYVYSPATYVLGGISQNVTNAAGTYIPVGIMSGSDTSAASGYCLIQGTNATGVKPFQAVGGFNRGGDDSQQNYIVGGVYTGTSVVSSISMFSTSGNFDAGTVYVYTTA